MFPAPREQPILKQVTFIDSGFIMRVPTDFGVHSWSTGSRTMAVRDRKTSPTWSDVKGKLVEFDRSALLGTIQDLYAASTDNQAFLRVRFDLGGDVLAPYKTIINRWLWPDVIKTQDTSVETAKKA